VAEATMRAFNAERLRSVLELAVDRKIVTDAKGA